jgi:uncharacterized protein YerC
MQISKAKVNRRLKKQIDSLLYQTVADIRDPEEAKDFLESFLAKTELEMASRRLGIIYFLDKERTYDYIKNNLAVSSTTVSAMAERMESKGAQTALEKIRAEEWATKWAKKITKMMGKGRA